MHEDAELDQAIADWLMARESDAELLPGAFAGRLAPELRARFLDEIEQLAAVDDAASLAESRDLPWRIGDFRVLGELGRGAAGVVYEAEHVSTGRAVAIKILHASVASDRTAMARFRREAAAAIALDHPGIVEVFDCGETDGLAWLAMERVRGPSLDRLLAARDDPRDVDHAAARALFGDPVELARRLAEVADALDFAHRRHVVHRDVKPANLIVRDDGRIAVLDFGLACFRDDDESALTRTGDLLGTPLYMAPEQIVGAENGSPRSDVYAVGAVLYECLCGRPPFDRAALAVVMEAILNAEPRAPHRVSPSVPMELSRVAMQCLEKVPARRYASAAELAEDLRRHVAGRSVMARSVGWSTRLVRQLRRRPLTLGLAVTLAVLAVSTAVFFGRQQRGVQRIERLERDRDLDRLPRLLAGAPERITVFGGASLRHYARFGLAQSIPVTASTRSVQAAEALELAEDLRRRFPGDAAVLRAHAGVLLDVGDDPDALDATLEELLSSDGCRPGDRAMAAVWHRRTGREERAAALYEAAVADDGATVAFWVGLWHQSAQRYQDAIDSFSRALASDELTEEQRYFALLHRGWCHSCPEIARLREAQDDLLQAGALRPAYGTARLLWAALHCLEEEPDLPRAVSEVQAVLRAAEPWLHVLTARVLQSLAEAGTWQDGPVRFGSEFSPIAAMPIAPAKAAALAGLSMQLLDGLDERVRESFEVAFHRIAGLTLVGEHAAALDLCARRLANAAAQHRAPLLLQRARVQLAAGRVQRSLEAVEAALAIAPDYVAAWQFSATLAAFVGDRARELESITRAASLLRAAGPQLSVYPDATAMLPQLELRRAALRRLLEATAGAEQHDVEGLGGVLHGADGPRIRARIAAVRPASTVMPLPDDSPLRWLLAPDAERRIGPALAHAAWREWLPIDERLPAHAALRPICERAGVRAPDDLDQVGLVRLLPNAVAMAGGDDDSAADLLRLADRCLLADPENSEARLLRGLVLVASERAEEAHAFLQASAPRFADDLRGQFVEAVAAARSGDVEGVRRALTRDDDVVARPVLEGAARAVSWPDAPSPADLLSLLR